MPRALLRPCFPPPRPNAGERILYVDESGTHGMQNIDANFPVLTIAGCAFDAEGYDDVEASLQHFKRETLGLPDACVHSRDIRHWQADFAHVVTERERREILDGIAAVVESARCVVISVTIRKQLLVTRDAVPINPYDLAVEHLIERFHRYLERESVVGRIVAESRGKSENRGITRVYERMKASHMGQAMPTETQSCLLGPLLFGSKTPPCAGLEIADLIAYPIARRLIDPAQENRAFNVVRPKLYDGHCGDVEEYASNSCPKTARRRLLVPSPRSG